MGLANGMPTPVSAPCIYLNMLFYCFDIDFCPLVCLASFSIRRSRGRKMTLKTKARSDPPRKPRTFSVSSSVAPASAPGVKHGRTSNVTDADVRTAHVVGPDVTCAALQPCLDTAR